MNLGRLGWKVLFSVMLVIFFTGIYDAAKMPDIIAPTHPGWVSFFVLLFEIIIMIGAFCYAFEKKILPKTSFWKVSIIFLFVGNVIILAYEFYNNSVGYEVSDIVHKSFFTFVIFCIYVLPAYLYYDQDLR